MQPIVVFIPIAVICSAFFFKRCATDLTQAILSVSYALVLNGNLTTVIKLIVGRLSEEWGKSLVKSPMNNSIF